MASLTSRLITTSLSSQRVIPGCIQSHRFGTQSMLGPWFLNWWVSIFDNSLNFAIRRLGKQIKRNESKNYTQWCRWRSPFNLNGGPKDLTMSTQLHPSLSYATQGFHKKKHYIPLWSKSMLRKVASNGLRAITIWLWSSRIAEDSTRPTLCRKVRRRVRDTAAVYCTNWRSREFPHSFR